MTLRIKRHWFRGDSIRLPSGTELVSHMFYGAFDCGRPCPFCRKDLQRMYQKKTREAPSGVTSEYWEGRGWECVHCRVGADDDSRGAEWLPLADFLRVKLADIWGKR